MASRQWNLGDRFLIGHPSTVFTAVALEAVIRQANDTLMRPPIALETRFGEDLDRNGRVR